MNNTAGQVREEDKHPIRTGIFGFLIAMFGFIFLGPLIGSVAAFPFLENGLADLLELSEDPTAKEAFKIPLYIMQGFTTLLGLIILPWIFLVIRRDRPSSSLFPYHPGSLGYLLTAGAVILFMGVNAIFIDWNANVNFPEALKGFEEWARASEDALADATEFLTTFNTTGEFILGLIVIAVLPSIGEEIVFRGILQRKLNEGGMNHHMAIWISAILFSAIHVQFFGFVPRVLLGALFGYLYYWSGDLRVPIFAHFVNNGFMITMVYINQLGLTDINLEDTEAPSLVSAVLFAIITAAILYVAFRYYQTRRPHEPVENSF